MNKSPGNIRRRPRAAGFSLIEMLAVIVLIRTFLSWSLELEIEGHWPWQARREGPRTPDTSAEQL